jgi:hypothetical protein
MAERKGGVKNTLCEINFNKTNEINKTKQINKADQIDLSREMPFSYLTGAKQTK